MARTPAFDYDEKLQQAMHLFWEKGFEATSMQEVADRLELNRSSIYNTYGSKHDLYLAALDQYRQSGLRVLREHLQGAPAALAGLHQAFEQVANETLQSTDGCFMTNAAAERAASDRAIQTRTCKSLDAMRALFEEAVRQAQEEGDISPSRDARAIGCYLTNAYTGIRVMARTNPSETVLRSIVRETLRSLTCTD